MKAVGLKVLIAILWTVLLQAASQSIAENTSTRRTAPAAAAGLLINEVNADNPGVDTSEFLELYHTSGQQVRLEGYFVVFYNGNNNKAYKVVNLNEFNTNNEGFFLMGSSSVMPKPDIILPDNTIQNGPDAIALYYGNGPYQENMKVTNKGLVDALVHKSRAGDRADILLDTLTPGKKAFLEDSFFWADDESMERCQGLDTEWKFQVGKPSPGKNNFCSSPDALNSPIAVINEVSTVSSSQNYEFVELQGRPNGKLDGLVLVLFDGVSDKVYLSVDINGKASSDGLFLIGDGDAGNPVDQIFPAEATYPVFRNGPAAVALYSGNASSFPPGAPLTNTSLIDALVYTNEGGQDEELMRTLTPRMRVTLVHDERFGPSISRCSCCTDIRDPTVYVIGPSTPRVANDCPSRNFSQKIMMCMHIPELWQLASEESQNSSLLASLTSFIASLFGSGITAAYIKDRSYTMTRLEPEMQYKGLLTAKSAYQLQQLMTEYRSNVVNLTTVLLNSRNITLYPFCNATDESNGSVPHLLSSLAPLLSTSLSTPGQKRETTKAPTQPTPRSHSEVLISELNADNPGSQEDLEYIELLHVKGGSFPLDDYWLVLYNGKDNKAYKVLNLMGFQTNDAGYFLLGSAKVTPKPKLILPANTIQNGADAVALYFSTEAIYRDGMPVTNQSLVDAMVYKTRASDQADRLLEVLTPGQEILLKDTGFSSGDESFSRCNNLNPIDHSSYQVTLLTPLMENACSSSSSSPPPTLPPSVPKFVISELNTVSDTDLDEFVELKGPPQASLSGYKLLFFNGQHSGMYEELTLQGTANGKGYYVVGSNRTTVSAPDALLPAGKSGVQFLQRGTHAIALYYNNPTPLVGGSSLVDALVYTTDNGSNNELLERFTPGFFIIYEDERSWGRTASVSRCSCCDVSTPVVYTTSRPTPGMDNDCPTLDFTSDLRLCLLTLDCSIWTQNTAKMLYETQRVLVAAIEEHCACGFSIPYLQDFVLICNSTKLSISGKILAKSEKQQQKIQEDCLKFLEYSNLLNISGNQVKVDKECSQLLSIQISTASPVTRSVQLERTVTFQGWGIALLVLGAAVAGVVAAVAFYYYSKRRTRNYSSIEMSDQTGIASEF